MSTLNPHRAKIELAWFDKGSAVEIAQRFPDVTRSMVCAVWKRARSAGRLPNIGRPRGGFDWDELLRARAQAQSVNSIPPITPATKAPVGLKEVA